MLSSPASSKYFGSKVHQILHGEKPDTWHMPLSVKKKINLRINLNLFSYSVCPAKCSKIQKQRNQQNK